MYWRVTLGVKYNQTDHHIISSQHHSQIDNKRLKPSSGVWSGGAVMPGVTAVLFLIGGATADNE